jgi:AraC-like DNA-binding protein
LFPEFVLLTPPSFRFYAPAERLRPYIAALYYLEFPPGEPVEDLMLPEWSGIRFALRGDWSTEVGGETQRFASSLFGHSSRAGLIRCATPGLGFGIGVLPLGWTHLIGLPPAEFVDRGVDLAQAWGSRAAELFARLAALETDEDRNAVMEAFLLDLLDGKPEPAQGVVRAHQVINDPAVGTVEEFAAALGVTPRHATRLSLQMFGFTPKLLLRRQRFLRTLGVLRENLDRPWAEQLDSWYYDQSHFVRDFRRFIGLSPTDYFSSRGVLLMAAGQARRRALGQSLQGLHAPAAPA